MITRHTVAPMGLPTIERPDGTYVIRGTLDDYRINRPKPKRGTAARMRRVMGL
jgi:hypothetical protein